MNEEGRTENAEGEATYRIHWTDKRSGRTGTGTKYFTLADASKLVRELNDEYPHMIHEIV